MHLQTSTGLVGRVPGVPASSCGGEKGDIATAPDEQIRSALETPDESSARELYASLLRQIMAAAMTADIAGSTEQKLKTAYRAAIVLGAKIGLIGGDGLDDELGRAAAYLLT